MTRQHLLMLSLCCPARTATAASRCADAVSSDCSTEGSIAPKTSVGSTARPPPTARSTAMGSARRSPAARPRAGAGSTPPSGWPARARARGRRSRCASWGGCRWGGIVLRARLAGCGGECGGGRAQSGARRTPRGSGAAHQVLPLEKLAQMMSGRTRCRRTGGPGRARQQGGEGAGACSAGGRCEKRASENFPW